MLPHDLFIQCNTSTEFIERKGYKENKEQYQYEQTNTYDIP